MTPRWRHFVLWAALAAGLCITAYLLIATTFMFYDDEGYLLYTLRSYLEGGRLYDEIFSQYGPTPYVYHQLITSFLQEPITHTLGRLLTTVHWVAAVLLAGALAHRLTGRQDVAVAASLSAFGLLWQMSAEPSHPGSMISVFVALLVVGAARLAAQPRSNLVAGGLGALTALLVLTKINVGLLAIAGLACVALRFTNWPDRWRKGADAVAVVGLLAVPWGLMGRNLAEPWVVTFAIQFTLGAAGLLWVTPVSWSGRPFRPMLWAPTLVGFSAAALAVCGTVWLRGSPAAAIADAVLFSPLRQPSNFMFGFTWVSEIWPVAAGAWLLTARAGWELRQRQALSMPVLRLLIAARLATLLVFAFHVQTWLTIFGVGRFIVFCLPLLPLFVVPLTARTTAANPRQLACWCAALLAIPQVLHAFPVAGSQMGWGTFMLVPIFVAGLSEAWGALGGVFSSPRRWLLPAGAALLLSLNAFQFWLLADNGWKRYHASRPLDLPGAEIIRLDGPARLALRILTLNASIHADFLFSRPGMFSYNLWSGVPTPTKQNATHWFWLLSEPQQRRILETLQTTPRSALITNRPLDEFLGKINVRMTGPLIDHIAESYEPLFQLNDFSFLVQRGREAVSFGKIDLKTKPEPEADGRTAVLLQSNVVLDGKPEFVRLERSSYPWKVIEDFSQKGAEIYVEPINSAGRSLGPATRLGAGPLRGLYRLSIFSAEVPETRPTHDVVLIVTDSAGRVLSESIF